MDGSAAAVTLPSAPPPENIADDAASRVPPAAVVGGSMPPRPANPIRPRPGRQRASLNIEPLLYRPPPPPPPSDGLQRLGAHSAQE